MAGFVYILEVRDIDLPVCKIGYTRRHPEVRCEEINRASTGDFLWQVAHYIAVNDCAAFERLVHRKLNPYRQKNKEFFNIDSEVALRAVVSILENESEFHELENFEPEFNPTLETGTRRPRIRRKQRPRIRDETEYAQLLAAFTKTIGCKGRPFGQLNKPYFGMSDGVQGVQWNLAIDIERNEIRFGVNLEGLAYRGWPIARFLLAELEQPALFEARERVKNPQSLFLGMTRDAWQVTARPQIVEQDIGPRNIPLSQITPGLWHSMLAEALDCLDANRAYRGRAKQRVTLVNSPRTGTRERDMWVSPHLTIWALLGPLEQAESALEPAKQRLEPVHQWVTEQSERS